jgi:protein ImuB
MERTACVSLPNFSVQLLLKRYPDWKSHSVAVVEVDKPQGTIFQVNERARSSRILPGMRYAAGLALDSRLRAAVISKKELKETLDFLVKKLRSFSPRVESAVDEPGIFWLDAGGLERLFGSLNIWAKHIQTDIRRDGFDAAVVVGFNRFGSYVLAKGGRGVFVLKDPLEEQTAARQVSIDCLDLEPRARELMVKLGVKTVGHFIDLPSSGIVRRFGPKAHHIHQLASGRLHLPLMPDYPHPPAMQGLVLDHPENDIGRIMAVIRRLLFKLLRTLSERGLSLIEVQVRFRFDRIGEHTEYIRPAAPTLDSRQLLDLIRLRLRAVKKLCDAVVEAELVGKSVAAVSEQLRLLELQPKRDFSAANRALARVRAEIGDGNVIRARLREGHLPEARFRWEPCDALGTPCPGRTHKNRLIRRFYGKPIPIFSPLQCKIAAGRKGQSAQIKNGPYIISGGWWQRTVHREYYFAEIRPGGIQWLYFDRVRKTWFLQGRVE